MPTSHHRQISTIMDAVILINPRSVLDIGVGFGKYGVLCREYLELWDGREDYHTFTRQIDGIEAFEDYLTPLHQYVYDHVYIGEASSVIKTLKTSYDLVLLIDVLEHLSETQGRTLIRELLKRNKGIIISTPKDIGHQDDAFQNPHEHHVSQWTRRKLEALAPALVFPDRESHIVYLGTPTSVLRLKAKQYWKDIKYYGRKIPLAQRVYRWIKN